MRIAKAAHWLQVAPAYPLTDRGRTDSDEVGGLTSKDDLPGWDYLEVAVPVVALGPVRERLVVFAPGLRHSLSFDLAGILRERGSGLLLGQGFQATPHVVTLGAEVGKELTRGDVKVSSQLVRAHRCSVTLHQMTVEGGLPSCGLKGGVLAGEKAKGPVYEIGAFPAYGCSSPH
ncbi:hypothetical protein ACRTEC_16690 [Janibacter indicus]